jgi:lysophospholipase
MITLLTRANISGFDASSYINSVRNNASRLPNIAIAASGGGYRAMLNGAGFLAAADSRTPNSTLTGHIGGLLQSTTYLAGLSGGNWLVGSLFANNFSSVVSLRDGSPNSNIWRLDRSIIKGPDSNGISILNTATYLRDIYDAVKAKHDAGFNTSVTDYWGRALSYQLVNATNGGPAYTFSSIALNPNFINGGTPFPISVADGRQPNTKIIPANSTVFEFNPFELGSWDPSGYAFVPMRYLGSNFTGGLIPAKEQCVRGFDNFGYVMGTSSSLFNQFFLQINNTGLSQSLTSILTDVLTDFGSANDDIAQYQPNPFYLYHNNTSISISAELSLVDGGEDGQNIPLGPLIQPQRGVDVIFAIDSSADTPAAWPNGTSLVATYERSVNSKQQNGTAFPSIPDMNTFINLGLNKRPTFFGCDASNITGLSPLIVYVPNAPYVFQSNFTTFTLEYSPAERNSIIQNGYNVATLGNGTVDSEWPACVACAILSRSFTKTGTAVPKQCQSCFSRYCWNGTTNGTNPGNYLPTYILKVNSGTKVGGHVGGASGMAFAIAFIVLAVAL